uniref:G-patch domain-containing protein n=1 Tax=Meloidogyne floridensis TaxID=298350 RepID=A0A915NSZ1_9BILA
MDWIKTEEASTSEAFSVADLVQQTASQFVFENVLPGFVYYNDYNAYYNHDTGYFYYPESLLYFHPSTQLYYYYNEQTKTYEVYENKDENKWTKKKYKKRATNLFGENFVLDAKLEDILVTELIFDLVDKCSFFAGDYSIKETKKRKIFDEEIFDEYKICTKQTYFDPTLSSDDELDENTSISFDSELNRRIDEEQIACNAPCIRLLEFPSNNLHIITILGASIGFGLNADIKLLNSQLTFNKEILFYINYFEEGNNGIYKLKLEIDDIILKLNEKQIKVWGSEQVNTKKYSKNVERHRQIKLLKQQYGLLDKDHEEDLQNNKEKYLDRAKQRRKLNLNLLENDKKEINKAGGIYVGCRAAPVPGCSTNSVHFHSTVSRKEEISENNKGFKLLKGMGWSEGQGLGKANQGMKGPIETIIKNNRAGLGMFVKTKENARENVANDKLVILEKVRQRYEQIDNKK